MKIVIYTQDMCGYCVAAKEEFETRKWKYTSHNIKHTDNYDNLKELLPNVKTVPQIWIENEHIGGYDELMVWLKEQQNISPTSSLKLPNQPPSIYDV